MWEYVTSNLAWSMIGFVTGYTVCKAEWKAHQESMRKERNDYR